ncbi:MAG: hypothetical protein HOP28_06625 [Gemmatimonadales bacterium]|nr:hypothetical protein [Gemmatimonadales bacterium]
MTAEPPTSDRFLLWFGRFQRCHITATAMTPAALLLLYQLGFAVGPRRLVGVGTYQGLAMGALTAGASDRHHGKDVSGVGVDVDGLATSLARSNARKLGLAGRLSYVTEEGTVHLDRRVEPIDLFYLDLDDPLTGKAGYQLAFEHSRRLLTGRAVVVAHDATSPRFTADLAELRRHLLADGRFGLLLDVPIDAAGMLIAGSRRTDEISTGEGGS